MKISPNIVPWLALAASGCGLLSTTDSAVQTGTVRVTAVDFRGEPAGGADVIVHDADGQLFARAKLGADGTADVESVADATVSVAIRIDVDEAALVLKESGGITTFTHVPLGAALRVDVTNPAAGKLAVDLELPAFGRGTYMVATGCGQQLVFSERAQIHVPTSCGASPRTIVVSAFSSGFTVAAVSVLENVELNAGTIQMPAFQPVRTITQDVSGDLAGVTYFGETSILDAAGQFNFFTAVAGTQGHAVLGVPQGDWPATRHVPILDFGSDRRRTLLERTESGAPQSATFARVDFLTPPAQTADRFGFEHAGPADYRSLFLKYGCEDCSSFSEASGRWELFGPVDDAPFVLPELPADLAGLTPDGTIFELAIGTVFEESDLDGYGAFLAADPARVVPGAVRRRAEIAVRTDE